MAGRPLPLGALSGNQSMARDFRGGRKKLNRFFSNYACHPCAGACVRDVDRVVVSLVLGIYSREQVRVSIELYHANLLCIVPSLMDAPKSPNICN